KEQTERQPPALPPTLRTVRIESAPPGAAITVNGDALGPAPVSVALPDGSTARIHADADGYQPFDQSVTVTQGLAVPIALVAVVTSPPVAATTTPVKATAKHHTTPSRTPTPEATTSLPTTTPTKTTSSVDLDHPAGPR